MDTRSLNAGRGLRLVFWGELLFLMAAICTLLGILTPSLSKAAGVLAAASFLLSLFGLVTAAHAYKGFQSALIFLVIGIILWVSVSWMEGGWPAALLNAACIIANYLMVAKVCVASAELLFGGQNASDARQIKKVRLRYLMCSMVSVACFLAASMSWLRALAEIVWCAGAIAGLFAGLIYLLFLRDVQELLRE